MKNNYITQAEYDFLVTRLAKLKKDDKAALIDLKHALNYGSETWHDNDMYDTAKNKQINIDLEKKEIDQILKSTKVLNPKDINIQKVGIGTRVILKDVDTGEILTINLGGREATRLGSDWVSSDSPLGKAVQNSKKDSIVMVNLPTADISYKVVEIEIA